MMKAAFYKGTKEGLSGLFEVVTRAWVTGPYAHVELIFSDGRAASSTFLDGGVRFTDSLTLMVDRVDLWDVVDLKGFNEQAALAWFEKHKGDPYDVWGDARFVVGWVKQDRRAEFCSESVAAALGFDDPWRYEPNTLASAVRRVSAAVAS